MSAVTEALGAVSGTGVSRSSPGLGTGGSPLSAQQQGTGGTWAGPMGAVCTPPGLWDSAKSSFFTPVPKRAFLGTSVHPSLKIIWGKIPVLRPATKKAAILGCLRNNTVFGLKHCSLELLSENKNNIFLLKITVHVSRRNIGLVCLFVFLESKAVSLKPE